MPSLKIGQQRYPAYWKGRIFLLDQSDRLFYFTAAMWTILPTADRGNTELLMTERTAIFNRDYHNITSQKYKSGNRHRRPACNDCNDRYDAKQNSGYSANGSAQKRRFHRIFPFLSMEQCFFSVHNSFPSMRLPTSATLSFCESHQHIPSSCHLSPLHDGKAQ